MSSLVVYIFSSFRVRETLTQTRVSSTVQDVASMVRGRRKLSTARGVAAGFADAVDEDDDDDDEEEDEELESAAPPLVCCRAPTLPPPETAFTSWRIAPAVNARPMTSAPPLPAAALLLPLLPLKPPLPPPGVKIEPEVPASE